MSTRKLTTSAKLKEIDELVAKYITKDICNTPLANLARKLDEYVKTRSTSQNHIPISRIDND